jgi:hypothetical protein
MSAALRLTRKSAPAARSAPALRCEYISTGLIFMILPGGFLGVSKSLALQLLKDGQQLPMNSVVQALAASANPIGLV